MMYLFKAVLLFCTYYASAQPKGFDCEPGDPRCTSPDVEELVFEKSPTNIEGNGSLDSLIEAVKNDELKFIFVGGKGGVGKTTSSSAIASLIATVANKRVLLVSTDPAHSLGDAWRTSFSNVPTSPLLDLDVMEIDPKETMEAELNTWVQYAKEFEGDDSESGDSKMMKQISSLQEWLSGIPGIDEATALSAAITHIESGRYDVIVFDTAPTGHTIKLLALPEILEQGIEKLQSWQTTLWGYWDIFKGLSGGGGTDAASKKVDIKTEVSQKLNDYKHSIQKVATMLQDQERTRFVVVCIAEFLSVSETQRLLQELVKNKVRASHIIVNQLVVHDSLSSSELAQLEATAEVGDLKIDQSLLKKTIHACRLTTSRKAIQQKYLDVLKAYPETKGLLDGICEVPLLAEEVTGVNAIGHFSQLLVTTLINEGRDISTNAMLLNLLEKGDIVRIQGLEKSVHFNGLEGKIVTDMNFETGRYGIEITYEGKDKRLDLEPHNLSAASTATAKVIVDALETESIVEQVGVDYAGDATFDLNMGMDDLFDLEDSLDSMVDQLKDMGSMLKEASETMAEGHENVMGKAQEILDDPEIKEMIANNPKLKAAVEDVLKNPMNLMQYMQDPELSPFIAKAMSKVQF